MKNYLCRKCKTHIESASQPSNYNCPSGGLNSFHEWTNLGDVGSTNYQCKKCGVLVHSASTPSTYNCPTGGLNSFHQWTKL
jgi:DNA-directed RNA polymerase subunit RPC12/RpoP